MRRLLLLALLLVGCQRDARMHGLQEGLIMAAQLVQKPELAEHGRNAQERLDFLFSPEGASLWPPRIPQELAFDTPHPAGTLPPRVGFLTSPDLPWSVVISVEGDDWRLQGFGSDLARPVLERRLPVAR